MKRFTRLLALSLTLVFSPAVFAGNSWTGFKTINVIQILGDARGGFILYLDSSIGSQCSTNGTDSLHVFPGRAGMTRDGLRAFLDGVMNAQNNGRAVNVLYDNSTTYCYGKALQLQ